MDLLQYTTSPVTPFVFNAAMFGPAVKKFNLSAASKVPRLRKTVGDNGRDNFETLKGKSVKPDPYKVFNRLYKLKDWTPECRKTNYLIWKNHLIMSCNADGERINSTLVELVKQYKLNPSESGTAADFCSAPKCYWDQDGQSCVDPSIEEFKAVTIGQPAFKMLPAYRQRQMNALVEDTWKRAGVEGNQCDYMTMLQGNRKILNA